jgi:hypothetical protein
MCTQEEIDLGLEKDLVEYGIEPGSALQRGEFSLVETTQHLTKVGRCA